ncbi:MAG: outer membrane protein transport protein [Rhizobiales bacterium]|nr:outer membrane protein transport protein [Hyphomicrobiales bacterium]
MANHLMKTTALGLIAACAFVGGAQAGGFSRGEADTDILYEDGTIAGRGGWVYVMPDRSFATISGTASDDDAYSENYGIPSFAGKFRVSDNFSCAITYTQPFGADSTYGEDAQAADKAADLAAGSPIGNAVESSRFTTDELGGTCAVNFDAGPGDLYFIGGVFSQSFNYTESKTLGTLDLEDSSAFGYRLGAAYEIKEYALRAEIMYRSQVDHEASGTFTNDDSAAVAAFYGIPIGSSVSASGTGSLPQSLELNLQSGIAPGWLAFGSIKWTDWSVLQTLNYTITNIGDQEKNFFWRDGWTVTGGVGHQFNEKISGALSLTWDRGVGTGADIFSDTWTLGAGAQIKHGPGVLRIGAAASYLTSGEQSTADGADFNATADGDWAYALSANYRISF